MVEVKLDKVSATQTEAHIAQMLLKSIESDVTDLTCTCCQAKSEIILHVNNSKMNVLRTEIRPCCSQFGEEIGHRLYDAELV